MSSEPLLGDRSPSPGDELSSTEDGRARNSGIISHPEQPEEVSFSSLMYFTLLHRYLLAEYRKSRYILARDVC
jgi:hypothetical protein